MSKTGTILVLNQDVSGMNRYLIGEMEKNWDVTVEDVPYPTLPRYIRMARTIHPRGIAWKKRFDAAIIRYHTSPDSFQKRSEYAQHIVARYESKFDIAFQISGLFNSFAAVHDRPRILFASYNTFLAYHEWHPWAPFRDNEEFSRWYRLEKELYEEADAIMCTNRYVEQSFIRDYGLDAGRLHYVGYGFNFGYLPDVEKHYNSNTALFVGYDFERKGGPTLVEAFRLVQEEIPEVRLRIIGPSRLDVRYRAQGVEHIPRIRDRSLLQKYFSEADFFVMPSLCEPFGLVFLEAMAHKNACIGSTNNAMPEIISDGETGYLVEPGNTRQLAAYMKRLFTERELKETMGHAAFLRVQEDFTWPICGERMHAVFRLFENGQDLVS